MNSELKGTIEKPGYYFYSADVERKRNLDILMMTQGWRQFIVEDTINNISRPIFSAETGVRLSGKVKSFYNHKKSAIAEVSLTSKNTEEFMHETIMTDTNGHFAFENLDFIDSTSVIIQAKKIDNKKQNKKTKSPSMNFHIEMDSFSAPKIEFKQKRYLEEFIIEEESVSISHEYLEPLLKLQKGTIILEEVVLEKNISEIEMYYKNKRGLVKEPSYSVDFENIKGVPVNDWLSALYGRVPGYNLDGTLRGAIKRKRKDVYGNEIITGLPLYLLDGFPIEDISIVSPADIDFVDVIHRSRATIYGSRGGNGVIAIYTFDGSKKPNTEKKYKRKGVINFKHPGYGQAKKFYEPVYNTQKKDNNIDDYRTTVHWNPTINLDKNNKANISFYTSDAISPYRIVLEGISKNGQIIHYETVLNLVNDRANRIHP